MFKLGSFHSDWIALQENDIRGLRKIHGMHMQIKLGSRDSQLAKVQVSEAQTLLRDVLPSIDMEPLWFSSPGDRDQVMCLEGAPENFFTSDLDEALRAGLIDCALHSAKDYPASAPAGIDWFWLPCRHDTRDVLVGSPKPRVVGVSSARRRAYAEQAFPEAELRPIRGTIERRLEQMDAGDYDAIIMAGVALERLGMQDRITQWISQHALPTPAGQGSLLLSFRAEDQRMQRIRTLFVRPVALASAGTSAETCSMGVVKELRRADVCLYDALLDTALLQHLPAEAEAIYVGKRSGTHSHAQAEICSLLVDNARMGRRVLRLKGGDAGIYGRLAEEVEALDTLALPYRVLPGVSSVQSATTGTGLLLTRRGITDRIHILSGHTATAHQPQSDGSQSEVVFMGTRCLADIVQERLAAGYADTTPIALVWAAGLPEEQVVNGTLADIVQRTSTVASGGAPGLILIGPAMDAIYRYREHGALRGMRVWVTCSKDVQERACQSIRDYGGKPISLPLIELQSVDVQIAWQKYDWLIVSSPAAVRSLLDRKIDLRSLPRILCCGPGTARALQQAHIFPDAQPTAAFSTQGILEEAKHSIKPGARVLRVRSDRAGDRLSRALGDAGFQVDDVVISQNKVVEVPQHPQCDAVFFASASAVEAYLQQFGKEQLEDIVIGVMGHKEAEVLKSAGIGDIRLPKTFTLDGSVSTMAGHIVEESFVGGAKD